MLQTLEYDSKIESIYDDDDGLTHYRLVSARLPPRSLSARCLLAARPESALRCGRPTS